MKYFIIPKQAKIENGNFEVSGTFGGDSDNEEEAQAVFLLGGAVVGVPALLVALPVAIRVWILKDTSGVNSTIKSGYSYGTWV